MNSLSIKCTVCEHPIELKEGTSDGERVTCPNCFAQLIVRLDMGRKKLICALCSDPSITYCPPDCGQKKAPKSQGLFNIRP